MEISKAVGKSTIRVDAWDKAAGRVKFNNDVIVPGILHAKIVISQYAHAKIKNIDVLQAVNGSGVQAVITGESIRNVLTGTFVEDRPPIAVGKVRYFGEPVAIVVADSELEAQRAAEMVKVEYEPLAVINSPGDGIKPDAVLIHEDLYSYRRVKECFPVPGTNIANHVKIRKGEMTKGWAQSEVIVEESFYLPQSDHIALETRSVRAEIKANGQ